jgi:hypothetical protein
MYLSCLRYLSIKINVLLLFIQDVFQFGIVVFFCTFGILPWQRADAADPNFAEFLSW